MEFPSTAERVSLHTADWKNRRIQREMEMRIWYYTQNPDQIDARLKELDREWDIERSLEANAASLALAGTLLGVVISRKFFFMPLVVSSFLLQHALQGWCPPVPLFRRIGIRTQGEIEAERYALKALRGDFRPAAEGEASQRISETLQAVKRSREEAVAYH